jgi:hypothetical protein
MPTALNGLRQGHPPAINFAGSGSQGDERFLDDHYNNNGRIFMRKLLLASAAILGATGSLAFAQAPANQNQGQYSGPYGAGPASNNNNNAWGIANTPSGSREAGPLSSIYPPNVNAVPAPGTIVIRLNGRVEVDVAASFSTADKGTGGNAGFKTNPIGVGSYFRLYPAFDGVAANGLRYGASVEIRENFGGGLFNGVTNGATATSPSSNSSAQTLFVRRAFTYLASDQAGIVRVGQGDGVLGLFDPCTFYSGCWDAGLGNINGGPGQSLSPNGGTGVTYAWLDQAGAEYANNKIVYLSPQYFGFDLGVQYAPSMGNAFQNTGVGVGCTQASANCVGLTSGNDSTRWYNQVGIGLRFQQTFGPVDVKAYGFYETAAKEINTQVGAAGYTTALPGSAAFRAAGNGNIRYDNLSFYKFGAAVTAMNLTAAVDYIGGAINNQLQMRPTGGASMSAVVTGLTYTNGPITLGAQFAFETMQGDARLTGFSQRHEYEAMFGGNYKLAPGVQLAAEYMYTYRHQGGFDFNTGTVSQAAIPTTRDAQGNTFVVATVLTW